MRSPRLMAAAFCLMLLAPGLQAARAAAAGERGAPVGRWLTQDRDAVIDIEPCGASLCGRIVGLRLDDPTDPIPTDHAGRSQCGLTIIRDAVPDGGSEWKAEIIDPRDGNVYHARMQLDAQRRLRVRGYIVVPLFGRTQVWTPFARPIPESCRLPPL